MAGSKINFNDFDPRNSRQMKGGGAAGGMATVGQSFAAMNKESADYGGMGKTNIAADGLIQRTIDNARTAEEVGRIENEAYVEVAKMKADAQKKASEQGKNSSIFGGIVKTGASLLGAALLSDERAKNTINDIDDALKTLRELRPVTFYYNEEYSCNPERQHHGFIAQEYKEVLPSATYYDDDLDRYCIDTHELVALLVRSVQQLENRVARLEATKALAGVK